MMATDALTGLQTTGRAAEWSAPGGESSNPLTRAPPVFNRAGRGGLLAAALALHIAAAMGFLFAVPLYDWPDEPAHFNYVRRLAAGGGLDVMRPDAWRTDDLEALKRTHFRDADSAAGRAVIDSLGYEAHQPPLYYLIAAVIYRLTASATAVKLLNLLLSCVAITIAWALARRLYPGDGRIAVAAAFLLALVPTRCFMAVSIGNDLLAEVVFGSFLLAVQSGARPSAVGALIGVGLLTKASALLALPLYAAWLPLDPARAGRGSVLADCAIATLAALAISSPWLAHNVALYGWTDPLALWAGALARRTASGSAPLHLTWTWSAPTGPPNFLFTLFASWWGVFGWMGMLPGRGVIALYAILSAAPLAGALRAALRGQYPPNSLVWLAAAKALGVAALVLYSLADFQPQGRYLMLASAGLGVLWAAATRAAFGRWLSLWTAASALALAWANLHSIAHVIPWYLAR